MKLENCKIPKGFFFNITIVPGSKDAVILKAIQHYEKQLENPKLPLPLQNIARGMIGNLNEYYELTNFSQSNEKLRSALSHLTKSARFMDSQSSQNVDIEATARIKSFYSMYEKVLQKCIDYANKDKEIPIHGIAKDIIATRDILHPRYDMDLNTDKFYKITYKTIYEYMEFIDNLNKEENEKDGKIKYEFVEHSENEFRNLTRPHRRPKTDRFSFNIPKKDFIDNILETYNIPHAYRYLGYNSKNLTEDDIYSDIFKLKYSKGFPRKSMYENLSIYSTMQSSIRDDDFFEFRNEIEADLINSFSDKLYAEYEKNDLFSFTEKHFHSLTPFQKSSIYFMRRIDSYFNYPLRAIKPDKAFSIDFNEMPDRTFRKLIADKLEAHSQIQYYKFEKAIKELIDCDINKCKEHFNIAKKACHFAHCSKDYMRNPKATGYQSFHIGIKSPFGFYEKQIRTEEQDDFAERGPASHQFTYKSGSRDNFHRLKIPAPIMPKRDSASGDLIQPLELGILPFEQAVKKYYGTPFEFFSDGVTYLDFFNKYVEDNVLNTPEFDKAMLNLTPSRESVNFIQKIKDRLFPVKNEVLSEPEPIICFEKVNLTPEVPADISSQKVSTPQTNSNTNSDSYDDR